MTDDFYNRQYALKLALQFALASPDDFDADDTVETATTFYEFLKGDNK